MGTKTEKFNLNQIVATDTPDWLTTYNEDMTEIEKRGLDKDTYDPTGVNDDAFRASNHNMRGYVAAEAYSPITQSDNVVSAMAKLEPAVKQAGDMQKGTYDKDGDGKVDIAEYADVAGSVNIENVVNRPVYLPNQHAMTMQFDGKTVSSYDGSAARTYNVTADAIGAASLVGGEVPIGQLPVSDAIDSDNSKQVATSKAINSLRQSSSSMLDSLNSSKANKSDLEKGLSVKLDKVSSEPLTINISGSGKPLLHLKTERPWTVEQVRSGGESALAFRASSNGKAVEFLSPSGHGFSILTFEPGEGTCRIEPTVDLMGDLGRPSLRYNNSYFGTGPIVSSDEKEKANIQSLDIGVVRLLLMSLNPVQFKYKSGDSGRFHYGLISQEVERAMHDNGLLDTDFAGLIKSPIMDENGSDTGEDRYGLRYEEFIAPLILMVQEQQKQIEEQQKQIDALLQRVVKLEENVYGD